MCSFETTEIYSLCTRKELYLSQWFQKATCKCAKKVFFKESLEFGTCFEIIAIYRAFVGEQQMFYSIQ